MDLNKIIEKCIQNDRAAQKQLYMDHADYVMGVARRYAKDMAEAKDIVQNTFIRVFKSLESFSQEKGKFKYWIARITINEALAIKRKDKRWNVVENPEQHTMEVAENVALDQLNYDDLLVAIKELPETQRDIIQLYYVDDLDHKEIAALMGIEVSSSRARLSRARKVFINHWKIANSI